MHSRFLGVVALTLFVGCSSGVVHLENLGPDALFDRGMKELAARHWQNATEAFDRLVIQYPSYARVQEARYRLAEAYFGKKEYVTAANEFSRLASDYPAGPWADDARFRVCESYERLSPAVELDQQYTQAAIDHCQSLIAYYPNSEFAPKAKEIASRLTEKLAQKLYLAGDFYFRRRAYDSSLIYFDQVLKTYPTSNAAAQSLLRMVEAYNSIGDVEEAKAAKERLLREFPGSAAAKEAAEISLAKS